MKKFFALLLILALVSCAAFADTADTSVPAEETETVEAAEEDPVIATFEGEPIYRSQLVEYAEILYSNGIIEYETDYDTTLEYIISVYHVVTRKASELGLDVFTEEEEAALWAEAEAEMEACYAEYINYFGGTEDADTEALHEEAVAFYESYGYTVESEFENIRSQEVYNRIANVIDAEPTEEQIMALYNQQGELEKGYFESDIYSYEVYTNQYGYESNYVPEGYRGVIQILIQFDGDAMTAYKEAIAAEGATEEEIAAAKEALLATRADDINDIYTRLEAGEAFETLIGEYNADPGMSGDNLKEGYMVHRDSVMWDPAFTDAAFAENMTEPGCWSEPSIGTYGAYIVYYLRDVPGGIKPISDDTYQQIRDYLVSEKIYSQLVLWSNDYEIVYNGEALAELKAEAE